MVVSIISVGAIRLSACCFEGCAGGQWHCSGAIKLDAVGVSYELRLEIRGNGLVMMNGRGRKFNLCDNQSSFGGAAPGWLNRPENIVEHNEGWYLVVSRSNSKHGESEDIHPAFKPDPLAELFKYYQVHCLNIHTRTQVPLCDPSSMWDSGITRSGLQQGR